MHAPRLIAALFAFSLLATAQQPEGPKPPKPPPGEPPRRGPGDRGPGDRGPGGPRGDHGGPGNGGMMNSLMRPPVGFEKLSEEEKKKIREVMAKAWNRPEVIAARDRAMQANEDMRNTLQAAIREIDPAVDAVLEKIKPPYPLDHRGLPQMPKPDSPEFPKFLGLRLGAELMSVAKPGRHEETRRFHDRVMQSPRIVEAISAIEKAEPGQRIELFMKLRDTYRQVAAEEFAKFPKPRDERGPPDKPKE